MDEISQISEIYFQKFNKLPPIPECVDEDFYIKILKKAIQSGSPIDFEFDFYPDVPDNASI